MISRLSAPLAAAFALLGCSSNDTANPSPIGAGGSVASVTGGQPATGGQPTTGGALGGSIAQGGLLATGGSAPSGGRVAAGGQTSNGGAVSTGGRVAAGGAAMTGGNPSTGGQSATGGVTGGNTSTGGRAATGGNPGGGAATGGSSSAGGTSSRGGANSTGGITGIGGAATGGSSSAGGTSAHMYTSGSDLYTYCGEKVLLRGVNQMSVWTDPSGSSYPAIASFGTNAIRIVYETAGSAAGLDTLLTKAEANKMIAMPELHDATGKFDGVTNCVNWWAKSDVVSVIKKHEKWTLLNIANEAGDSTVTNATFQSTYTSALTTLRNAGLTVPIVIDGSGWGQNVEQLLAVAPALLAADPQKNVIFSWHEYTGGSSQNARITKSYEQSKSLGIVLINGEFASGGAGACTPDIPYKFLISEAQRVGIGWLAWSWDVSNSDCKSGGTSIFDMTTNLTSASAVIAGWPADVMRDDPNSIKNTSIRHCEWK